MFRRYRFESEIYPGLSRIPLHVRMKLDLTGVKLSLAAWLALSFEERLALCHFPVDSDEEREAFVLYLDALARRVTGAALPRLPSPPERPWENPDAVPPLVAERSRLEGGEVTVAEWKGLSPHHRYALFKLAGSGSEPEAFAETLQELRESARSS